MSLTSRQVNALLASRISATAPETMGVAALVPPKLPLYRCPLSVVAILALLAALAVGLLFLLPGGPLQAQDANGPIEYDENGTGPVATYTAVDPEGTAITSGTLDGTDADAFTIVGGVLRFAETPDYEMPADVAGTSPSTAAANDNEYEITIQAMDSTGKTGMQEVMVEVINVDEDGTVTLSARQPLVAVAFTASLIDPDADATNPTPTSGGSGPSPGARTAPTPTLMTKPRPLHTRRPMPQARPTSATTCGRR